MPGELPARERGAGLVPRGDKIKLGSVESKAKMTRSTGTGAEARDEGMRRVMRCENNEHRLFRLLRVIV